MTVFPTIDDDQDGEDCPDMMVTLAEWHTMILMPGGVCLQNYMSIRGLSMSGDPETTIES